MINVRAGFTLVEMLVYMAILLVVSTASVIFLISLDELVSQYRLETELYRANTNILEQVLVASRQAEQFELIGSVQHDAANGALALSNGATTTRFVLNSGVLSLEINGVDQGSLTHPDVTVTEFTVYHYPTAEGEFVRVRLGLSGTVEGVTKTTTMYGGAVIRGAL